MVLLHVALDNFAILCVDVDVATGSVLDTSCQDGTPRGDVGLTALFEGGAASITNINGTLRFSGASLILGVPPIVTGGITESDPMVGVIATLPALINSYLALAPSAVNFLPLSPSATTLHVVPGVNLVAGTWNLTFCHIVFTGGLNSSYIILIQGDANLTNIIFDSLPPGLIVVVDGQISFLTSLAPLTIVGQWMSTGPMFIDGSETLTLLGQLLIPDTSPANGLQVSSNVSVSNNPLPATNSVSIIDAGSLANIALPIASLCR